MVVEISNAPITLSTMFSSVRDMGLANITVELIVLFREECALGLTFALFIDNRVSRVDTGANSREREYSNH